MKVVSGATAADGRYVSVELEESDVPNLPEKYGPKHVAMMKAADALIVKYFYDAGVFTSEYAAQRMKEINSR